MKLGRLALFTILLTYALIVFGGYVASSESGMGCGPEWPLCNGEVIPILQGDTLIEFAHRVIGAILGVLTIILFIKIMRTQEWTPIRSVAWGMLFLLTIQVLLGAVVVVLDLPALVVSAHLIIAMVFLASLIWIWRSMSVNDSKLYIRTVSLNEDKRSIIIKHLNILLALLLLTLAFGAYVKHQSYGLACGWLECGNSALPMTMPEIIQTIHRVLAVASTIYIVLLTLWSFSRKWGVALQNRLMLTTLAVLIQVIIGVLTVVTYLDIPWAVLHLAAGTALFGIAYEARAYVGIHVTASKKAIISSNGKRETHI